MSGWANMTRSYKKLATPPRTFFSRTRKLPCIFAALFVCYSSRLRLRDSLLRPCYDFLLFFTTQTRPVHRETDNGDEKFITPINKIHNPILGYVTYAHWKIPEVGQILLIYWEYQILLSICIWPQIPNTFKVFVFDPKY